MRVLFISTAYYGYVYTYMSETLTDVDDGMVARADRAGPDQADREEQPPLAKPGRTLFKWLATIKGQRSEARS